MSDVALSSQDQRILKWLSLINDPHRTKVEISKRKIRVSCGDVFAAQMLWKTRHILSSEQPLNVEIYVHRRIYGVGAIPVKSKRNGIGKIMTNTWAIERSKWAQSNNGLFMAIPGSVFVHGTSREQGYPYLAVRPDITEARLNKPIAQLIGQPVRVVDPAIALPKERAIEQAIATGTRQSYSYDHCWNGVIWEFKVEVVPAGDEVIVIVTDADDRAWQRSYWLNLAE